MCAAIFSVNRMETGKMYLLKIHPSVAFRYVSNDKVKETRCNKDMGTYIIARTKSVPLNVARLSSSIALLCLFFSSQVFKKSFQWLSFACLKAK